MLCAARLGRDDLQRGSAARNGSRHDPPVKAGQFATLVSGQGKQVEIGHLGMGDHRIGPE